MLILKRPIKKLIKQPQSGDLIKVYKGNDGILGYYFGVAVETTVVPIEDNSGKESLQEKVVVKPVFGEFDYTEVNFFLCSTKVINQRNK